MTDPPELVAQYRECLYGLRRLGYYTDTAGPVGFGGDPPRHLVVVRRGERGRPFYYVEGPLEHVLLSLEYALAFGWPGADPRNGKARG